MSSGTLPYSIEITDTPCPKAREALARPLLAYNETLLGSPDIHPLSIVIRSKDNGHVIGGLWGAHVISMAICGASVRARGCP